MPPNPPTTYSFAPAGKIFWLRNSACGPFGLYGYGSRVATRHHSGLIVSSLTKKFDHMGEQTRQAIVRAAGNDQSGQVPASRRTRPSAARPFDDGSGDAPGNGWAVLGSNQ